MYSRSLVKPSSQQFTILSTTLTYPFSNALLHLELDKAPKMNQKSLLSILNPLCSPLIYSHIFLFYLLTRTALCSVDPTYEACEPKTCGNHSISYPFYIEGTQKPFCGNPGFGLTCDKNGFPILNISNTLYIIDRILYQNQSLRVSNAVFSRPNITRGCFSPTQNLTLPNNLFRLVPNQSDVVLFFGCDLPSLPREVQGYAIGCSAENETSSVLAFYEEDQNLSFVSGNCTGGVVNAKVEGDGKEGIQEALRKGFWLNWIAADCRQCNSSGGRCGFDPGEYKFKCYCTDRVHSAKCDLPG